MAYSLDSSLDSKWQAASKLKTPKQAIRSGIAPDGTWEYCVHLKSVRHDFHPLVKNVKIWTYGNGDAFDEGLGVTIEGQSNVPVRVEFENDLINMVNVTNPDGTTEIKNRENVARLIDLGTLQGMEEEHMRSTISHNQVHLHGARVPWTSDGSPMNVFHPNESRGYYYPNNQAAATMWYHDHAMDVTRFNVYAGLAGMYLLRDPAEVGVLPECEFEVPIILQDRSFTSDLTKLRYEQSIDTTGSKPVPTPEFIGDYPVVNGKIWPTMKAKRAVYRCRLVNGANTRYFKLSLTTKADPSKNIEFHIVGTDGGFLPAPLRISELVLAPGERVDILLDLTNHAGADLILRNSADIPYPGNAPLPTDDNCAELLRIQVTGALVSGQDKFKPSYLSGGTLALPARVDPLTGGDLAGIASNAAIEAAIKTKLTASEGVFGSILPVEHLNLVTAGPNPLTFNYRRFVLEEYQLLMPTLIGTAFENLTIPTVLVNGKTGSKNVDGVTTADPVQTKQDDYEVWEFVNFTPDSHPMHIHLVQFKVLSRIQVNMADPTGQAVDDDLTRPSVSPGLKDPKRALGYNYAAATKVEGYETTGWKDTVQCEPCQVTRVLMRLDGYSGEYVYHCHILEHEDMGMMFDLNVEP